VQAEEEVHDAQFEEQALHVPVETKNPLAHCVHKVELEQAKQLLEHTGPQVDELVSVEPLEQVEQVVELVQIAQFVMHGEQTPLSRKYPGLH
jgi:hypothetical protein